METPRETRTDAPQVHPLAHDPLFQIRMSRLLAEASHSEKPGPYYNPEFDDEKGVE
jgi:hypothetical protein